LLKENNGHKKVPEHRQRNKENNFIVNSLHLITFSKPELITRTKCKYGAITS